MMTPHDLDALALKAAKAAVAEFVKSDAVRQAIADGVNVRLAALGIHASNDEDVAETRKDMQHLRTWREIVELMQKQGISAAVRWIILGILGALATGLYVMLHR